MSEPYVMEWYPEDGGYASLSIHGFDALSGTLDGINRAGLVVAIMADDEALAALGPLFEPHFGRQQAVGLHELQVMRWLLDTCGTVEEARAALLGVKQYYRLVPCHYIVADRAGHSFVYENSTGRNVQHVLDGRGRPQVVTNFQLYRHATGDSMPTGSLTLENNAFWRYAALADQIAERAGRVAPNDMKAINACVNVQRLRETLREDPGGPSIAASVSSRTLWHSLYDQHRSAVEVSFYLGDEAGADGTSSERRSEYLTFALDAR